MAFKNIIYKKSWYKKKSCYYCLICSGAANWKEWIKGGFCHMQTGIREKITKENYEKVYGKSF